MRLELGNAKSRSGSGHSNIAKTRPRATPRDLRGFSSTDNTTAFSERLRALVEADNGRCARVKGGRRPRAIAVASLNRMLELVRSEPRSPHMKVDAGG
jgi:hypothetical protein